jgi:hypothetical protein
VTARYDHAWFKTKHYIKANRAKRQGDSSLR